MAEIYKSKFPGQEIDERLELIPELQEGVEAAQQAADGKYTKPASGIPAEDIADDVIPDVSDFITNTVNDLVNYYRKSETYSRSEVQQLIAAIQGVSFVSVASLPTPSADTMGGKIYLVPSANPDEQNVKDEFITIQDGSTYAWEQIGSTAIDLSGYVTTQQLNTALAAYTTTEALTSLLAAKQDTISDLSAIRSGAAAGATAYQKPQTGIPASDLAAGVIPSVPTDIVKYSSQSLTDAQKEQARTNIGAAAAAALTALETALATKYTKPSSGIPETDLAANVQSALALARTSIQSLADYYDKTQIDSLLAAVSSEQYVDVATLPTASADTLGKIYLVGPTNGVYDRYYTSYDGTTYSWVGVGTTEINLANYATVEQLNQLSQKVANITIRTDSDADLDVIDEEGNVLARFEDGNFRVKNFDSAKVVANLGVDSAQEFDTTQAYVEGTIVNYDGLLYRFIYPHEPGDWNVDEVEQTNVMESSNSPISIADSLNDADLDIRDDNYYVLARFKNGHIKTKKFDSEKIEKDFVQKDLDIFFNAASEKQHYDTVSSTTKNLSFPYDLKKNICFALKGEFSSFATITIGKGYNAYSGYWFVIDSTSISLYYNQGSTVLSESVAHGLTFSDFVKIVISNIGDDYCRFFIQTRQGQFSYLFDWIFSANGQTFFTTAGTLTNVDFIAACSDLKNDIWVFGDSYLGFANPARWPKQLRNMRYSDYLGDGLAGQSSSGAYSDLQRCLALGVKPKYLVWTLGMNDADSAWNTAYQQVKTLCESNDITLILATVPTVPSRNKENINSTVRNSGYDYIDFANAVGANSSGVWYSGYLSSDNVHPTELGAKALATQFIFDFILKH